MLRESDFPTYETWCADINIQRYLGGKTMNRVEAWRHLAHLVGHWAFRGYGYYAVEEKATGRLAWNWIVGLRSRLSGFGGTVIVTVGGSARASTAP